MKTERRFILMSVPGDREDGSDTNWYVFDKWSMRSIGGADKDRETAAQAVRELNNN